MRLELAFWSEDAAGARAQARAWAEAEPNVESCRVLRTVREGQSYAVPVPVRWTVTIRLTLRESKQPTLGLVA